jgi:nucleotide-binding universal stress UspA family protein
MSVFPTKILLATDGSEDAELAATTAVGLAMVTSSELHVVHVGSAVPEHFEPTGTEAAQKMDQEATRILEEQVKKIENIGGTIAQSHLRVGDAAREIVELAEELGVGLIAVGSRGRGRLRRLAMGSVSDAVVRHAHCGVMVVRWKPVVFPTKILLATDGSQEAILAAQTVADLVERTGSELHVEHAGWVFHGVYSGWNLAPLPAGFSQAELDQGARKLLEAEVERIEGAGTQVTRPHLRSGRADEEIVVLAEELGTDLIVLGCRGLGGVRRALMGSVSESVVRHAHCPVLVARV